MNTYFRKMIAVMTICACVGGGAVFADSTDSYKGPNKMFKIHDGNNSEGVALIKVLDESGVKAFNKSEVNWIEIEAPENGLGKPMHIIVPNGSVIESDTINMTKILEMDREGLGTAGPIEYLINADGYSDSQDINFIKIEKLDDAIKIETKIKEKESKED